MTVGAHYFGQVAQKNKMDVVGSGRRVAWIGGIAPSETLSVSHYPLVNGD
jgi:hypothetical protein